MERTLVLLLPHKSITDSLDLSIEHSEIPGYRATSELHLAETDKLVRRLVGICNRRYAIVNQDQNGKTAEFSQWFRAAYPLDCLPTGIRMTKEKWIEPYTKPDFQLFANMMRGDEFYLGGFHLDDCLAKMTKALEEISKTVFVCPMLTDIAWGLHDLACSGQAFGNLPPWSELRRLNVLRARLAYRRRQIRQRGF